MRITKYLMINEVKSKYMELRREGQSRAEATQSIIDNNINELTQGPNDDGLLVWIGLADAQFHRKELTLEVAQKGLKALEDLWKVNPEIASEDISRRKNHYAQAPMAERSVGRARTRFHCKWKVGDVYAYKLVSEKANKLGIVNTYMLYQKVDEIMIYNGSVVPIVTIRYCKEIPESLDPKTMNQLPPLRLACGRFGTSENKYEYRTELIVDSDRQMQNSSLIFLGNYPVYEDPRDEQRFKSSNDIMMMPLVSLEMLSCAFWKVNEYYKLQ